MRRVYHATMGKTEEVAYAFKGGARANFSDGNGQGYGFYVWKSLENALKHLEFLEQLGREGDRIIVQADAKLDENWDVDYEIHPYTAARFISDNLEKLKRFPNKTIKTMKGDLLPSHSRISPFGTIVFLFQNGKTLSSLAVSPASFVGNVKSANVLGNIMDYMSSAHPQETSRAKRDWIESPEICAVRYCGHEPLPISRIEVINRQINSKV